MKIRVHFRTGVVTDFIVPEDILAVDFQRLAEPVGGKIRRLEFL